MSSTVGDLSGKHVATSTVRVESGSSTIEGVLTDLHFDADYGATIDGERFYTVRATLSVGDIRLYDIPLDTPARILETFSP